MISFTNSQKGFSLIEMLLTIIVFTGLMLVVFSTLQNYAEKTLSRSVASYIGEIHTAVEDILLDPNHFSAIYDATSGGIIDIPLSDLINGTGVIPASANNLNSSFKNTTPWKTGFNIMIRAADDIIDPNDTPALEIIIATDQRIKNDRVSQAATYSKGHGGVFRGIDAKFPNNVESVFSAWNFPVANLNGTPWATIATSNPPSFEDGTYYIHYTHYNLNDVTGDYLYRDHVNGRPELNRMYTALDMGQNNIHGADDIDPQTLTLSAKAVINGNAQVIGNTLIRSGNFNTDNTLTAENARIRGLGSDNRGNFINEGNIDVDTVVIGDRISATDARFESGLNGQNDIISEDVQVNRQITVQNNLFADSLITDGDAVTLNTDQLNTSNIVTNSFRQSSTGGIATLDMNVNSNFNMNVTDPSNPNRLTVRSDLTINNLSTDVFGACDNGC